MEPTPFDVTLHGSHQAIDGITNALVDIQSRRQKNVSLPVAIIIDDELGGTTETAEFVSRIKGANDPLVRAIGVVILTKTPEHYDPLKPLGVQIGAKDYLTRYNELVEASIKAAGAKSL